MAEYLLQRPEWMPWQQLQTKQAMPPSGVGSAAKKAAKDLKGITTGIDELHIIDQSTDSSSGSDSGSAGAGSVDMGTLMDTSALDEADSKMQGLINRMKELASLAKKGFWDGFGDTGVFQFIQSELPEHQGQCKTDIYSTGSTGGSE